MCPLGHNKILPDLQAKSTRIAQTRKETSHVHSVILHPKSTKNVLKFLEFDFRSLVLWPLATSCQVREAILGSTLFNLRLRLIREARPPLEEGKQHREENAFELLKLDVVDLHVVQSLWASHADLVDEASSVCREHVNRNRHLVSPLVTLGT